MTEQPIKKRTELGIEFSGSNEKGQNVTLTDEKVLHKVFGTDHGQLANGLLRHCYKVLASSEVSDDLPGNDERYFMVNAISDIGPCDGPERLLAVQMVATHVALVRTARCMARATSTQQIAAHNSGFNKLARTYTAQMEALRKHRNGGKQTVTVQHVTVGNGGQAVVGNVQTGAGSK